MTDAVELVPLDEDSYYQDPMGFFARLRESRPVAAVRMPGYGRAWIVTRYADVRTVLTDPRLAKDVHHWPGGGRSRPSETTGVYAHMLHADPPDHTRLRRLAQKPFASPRAALRPRAEEIAAGLLDEMAACGDNIIDLLGRYARPLPITVICELQDPSLLPAAVEELLRFTSPVNHANDRFTTQDVPIGGAVMPAGEWVIPAIAPADWDPARFPDPDRLDLGRDTSGNVAFGHGVHHCLGAPLARMEAEVALGALLARFPRISLAVSPSALRWRPVSLMNGLESLPVRLG